ncbi:hypothetical protein SAMN02745130_03229 [Thiothrix eikelboomii]|uniref:Rap1a immunity protein domain-containing protein n=1 Tax=Thiothrix eikelboomii TaxID=92487 RepID=A0A1T4XNV1_9GAMM|nr:hypothetical protein [Thiothrix eikelboomii]SKA91207.1 hypothetical protein SAMN02745130_03229 [Thiothrix eikelboomii]
MQSADHQLRISLNRILSGLILGFCLLSSSLADSPAPTPAPSAAVPSNDYPTQARVEYVFGCMHKYGGENYDHLYGCVCAIDKIAEKIPYANFVATSTLAVMIKTPGERGGAFRDAAGGREAIKAFDSFIAETEATCGLKKKKPAAN